MSEIQSKVPPSGFGQVVVNIQQAAVSSVTMFVDTEIAPACVNPRPIKEAPSARAIAPLATMVPWKREVSPNETMPFTCQKILQKEAP
ncbi:MAG: hypothetical protein ABIQ11_09925, partial [Saprospiraceae bacterium]